LFIILALLFLILALLFLIFALFSPLLSLSIFFVASPQGTLNKAKGFLPFLQKAKRLPAVVDYVLSGHRFKLLIPKEMCAIAFSLSGVRCPAKGEAYSEEAIAFMRRRIMQRDVEVC
jgi:staphylococcal nuclease domain-containing protein 1